MENKEAVKWLRNISAKYIHGGDEGFDASRQEAIETAISALSSIEQIRWERDTAIAQLQELGYTLGQKIEGKPKATLTIEDVADYCRPRNYVIITAELFHFLADGVPGITPVPKLEQMYGKDVSGVIVNGED